jgi:hypothetical protein
LDANEAGPEVENQVIALALYDWSEHSYAELHRGDRDLTFGNGALLIRRQHRQRILVVRSDD